MVTVATVAVGGCGGTSHTSSTQTSAAPRPAARTERSHPTVPAILVPVRQGALPAARGGGAAAAYAGRVILAGGLSAADVSTDTVFSVPPAGQITTLAPLASPIHDAAAATVGGRLLVFGGGVSEGSDHILQVVPGTPRRVGTLPQALSDLIAVEIDGVAYVAGGWNGTDTNRAIYAVTSAGAVRIAGHLPVGVRYPAAAAIDGRLLVAGGELTSGNPTSAAFSFDPSTGTVTRLPDLPAPTDHAASAALNGRFYILGGLRRGGLTRSILSWAPGETRWRRSGALPAALADASAVTLSGDILVLGGRSAAGRIATVTRLVVH